MCEFGFFAFDGPTAKDSNFLGKVLVIDRPNKILARENESSVPSYYASFCPLP
jgi:hypothetical protein